MARVLILGAGISGLTVAYRLQQLLPAVDITVLEARDRPGGTIWTSGKMAFRSKSAPTDFSTTNRLLCSFAAISAWESDLWQPAMPLERIATCSLMAS